MTFSSVDVIGPQVKLLLFNSFKFNFYLNKDFYTFNLDKTLGMLESLMLQSQLSIFFSPWLEAVLLDSTLTQYSLSSQTTLPSISI